jgi:hypothetical protein
MNQLINSLASKGAPPHLLAGLEVLQFQSPSADRLLSLAEAERRRFFEWCDVRQLTLLLPHVCGSALPTWVSEAVVEKTARYERRFQRLKRELFEIVDAFNAAGLEFVMLKGLSHQPAFTPDARMRAQGDIDLWLSASSVYEARDLLRGLGYEQLLASKSRHLPPMVRPSTWVWRGDLFDPEMPISVELHYELWSEQAEHIAAPGLDQFWERKQFRTFDGRKIYVLADEDLLGFAALHLLLHLLHGELPLQRAWEIARFLDAHAGDLPFWESWRNLHSSALRQLEGSIFYLVTQWFGSRSGEELEANGKELPVVVKSWLEKLYLAPLTREWSPNKLEIGLHLAFVRKRDDKVRVLFRRLLPTSLPLFVDRTGATSTPFSKLLKLLRQLPFLTDRFARHFVTFFPTAIYGLRRLLSPKS